MSWCNSRSTRRLVNVAAYLWEGLKASANSQAHSRFVHSYASLSYQIFNDENIGDRFRQYFRYPEFPPSWIGMISSCLGVSSIFGVGFTSIFGVDVNSISGVGVTPIFGMTHPYLWYCSPLSLVLALPLSSVSDPCSTRQRTSAGVFRAS